MKLGDCRLFTALCDDPSLLSLSNRLCSHIVDSSHYIEP